MSEPTLRKEIDIMTEFLHVLRKDKRGITIYDVLPRADEDDLTLSLRDILVAQVMIRRQLLTMRPVQLGNWLIEKLGHISDNFNGRTR